MRKRFGFSIVEILVSTVVFSLVMLGLISVFISANKNIIHIRERMTSAQLDKLFLNNFQGLVRYDSWVPIPPGNELSADSVDKPSGSLNINNRTFTETHTVSAVAGTDLRRVTSKITWTEPSS